MNRNYTISEIKKVVAPLAMQYGAERVFLFGSYARGDADEKSDIDLRIDKGTIKGLQFAGLLGDLEERFGKKVDLISTAGMKKAFRDQIASEEVLIYERTIA